MVNRFSHSGIQDFTHIDFSNETVIVAMVQAEGEPDGEKLVALERYARLEKPERGDVAAYRGGCRIQ